MSSYNLSAICTLQPIYLVVNAFARLCDKYSNSTFSCCPSFFNHGANYAWVLYSYHQSLSTLINPYKLGQLTTEEFLEGLLGMFPFMTESTLKISHNDIQRLNDNRDTLWSLRNAHSSLTTLDYAKALLEEAWNSIITFTNEDVKKLQMLFQEKTEPIYFISNTNALNVFKIHQWLHTHFPNKIRPDLNHCANIGYDNFQILEVGAGIYMMLSYMCCTYKTDVDNDGAQVPNTTPSLLQAMVSNVFQGRLDSITVISQYEKDRAAAEKLGIPRNNIHSASNYFQGTCISQEEVGLLLEKRK